MAKDVGPTWVSLETTLGEWCSLHTANERMNRPKGEQNEKKKQNKTKTTSHTPAHSQANTLVHCETWWLFCALLVLAGNHQHRRGFSCSVAFLFSPSFWLEFFLFVQRTLILSVGKPKWCYNRVMGDKYMGRTWFWCDSDQLMTCRQSFWNVENVLYWFVIIWFWRWHNYIEGLRDDKLELIFTEVSIHRNGIYTWNLKTCKYICSGKNHILCRDTEVSWF